MSKELNLRRCILEKPVSLPIADFFKALEDANAPPLERIYHFKPAVVFASDGALVIRNLDEGDLCSRLIEVIKEHRARYKKLVLARGLWREFERGSWQDCHGTNFPLTPAFYDQSSHHVSASELTVLWSSAAHCLTKMALESCFLPGWTGTTCSYGERDYSIIKIKKARKFDSVRFLKRHFDDAELYYIPPSEERPAADRASPKRVALGQHLTLDGTLLDLHEHRPDFGFFRTICKKIQFDSERAPTAFMVPSHQISIGQLIGVIGWAGGDLDIKSWGSYKLLTQAEVAGGIMSLDEGTFYRRLAQLSSRCYFADRLAVAPGSVEAFNDRVVEHSSSTFPGMSGGVLLDKPHILLFVQVQGSAEPDRNYNYGICVNSPLFVCSYTNFILPQLTALDTAAVAFEDDVLPTLHAYLQHHSSLLQQKGLWQLAVQFMHRHSTAEAEVVVEPAILCHGQQPY